MKDSANKWRLPQNNVRPDGERIDLTEWGKSRQLATLWYIKKGGQHLAIHP